MPYQEEKFYLTREGVETLKNDLKALEALRRAKVKDPEEDQSELLFINQRIGELSKILKSYELIKRPPREQENVVNLGATVLVDVECQRSELKIVGTYEAKPSLGRISNCSPVGKALLGRKVGEVVVVSSAIKVPYKILDIRYD